MKSNRVLSMGIILLGFANLVLLITRPVNLVLSWGFALLGFVLFILANIMYARERNASVYSDWDKRFAEEPKPLGAYCKLLNVRQMIEGFHNLCPRCQSSLWRKSGLGYLNRGDMVQLWKCLNCKYEEERFVL